MRILAKTPLSEIRAKEEIAMQKDLQLQALGLSLSEEKIKNSQKDQIIKSLGQEVAKLKIDIAMMKGDA